MNNEQNNIGGKNIPFNIQIGVTGHRDLVNSDKLIAALRDALTTKVKELSGCNENLQTPVKYAIISPLAEGADRLVASEAMRLLDADLEVVLPMSKAEYMEDFEAPESRAEFEGLLAQAKNKHELIRRSLAEAYPAMDAHKRRVPAYKKVGHYVVDNCDILIAIWDGKPPKSDAGTGAIVAYAKEKNKPIILIPANEPLKTEVIEGNNNLPELLKKYEQFNSYAIDPEYQASEIKKQIGYMFSGNYATLLYQKNVEIAQGFLMNWFVKADTIALKNQKMYQRVGFLIYVLSPIAVGLVALGILLRQFSWLFFPLEFLILFFAYTAMTLADRAKIHKKWIECRYLAEHIRCAIYFTASGFKPEVIKNTMQSHHEHQAGNWAAKMFNQILKEMPAIHQNRHEDTGPAKDFIKNCWIEDQMRFHAKKQVKMGAYSKRLELTGKIVFFTALVAALTHIVLAYHHFENETSLVESVSTFIAISFPALGASLGAIRIHREYSRLERQSADMVEQLKALKHKCDEISSQQGFAEFLVKAQEKMLHDVQGWLSLMDINNLDVS